MTYAAPWVERKGMIYHPRLIIRFEKRSSFSVFCNPEVDPWMTYATFPLWELQQLLCLGNLDWTLDLPRLSTLGKPATFLSSTLLVTVHWENIHI
jgi:hypothetical protein